MSSVGKPLITTQHIDYASTYQTQDLQGSLTNPILTEVPHSDIQV